MASSSSSPSDPANYSRSWSYHVFLSFRGDDTRLKFVGHLYKALMDVGIHTYKDDREISYGELIDTSIREAIEGSQIAVIVFSENFADSSWCLSEVLYIKDCEKTRGLTIVPIFYNVEPTVVRKQKRKYRKAFSKHEQEKEADVVVSWRKALREVSGHSGDEFKSAYMDESKFIEKFVKKISKMIRPLTPLKNDKLVGIEDRMRNLISQMQIGSDVVRMIGLWGVGGSGKTTLANSVYNEISWKFHCCCRIENVREKSSKYGLEKLQEQILSSVWKDNKVQVGSVEDGKHMTSEKLRLKKVLILLDDVNEVEQLEALAGSLDWFGKGSRILITTRDVHLLNVHGVINVHKVSLLTDEEATNLLCKLPGLDKSMGDFKELSQQVVSYASGLPLALTILGSSLVKANIKEQKSILAKMKVVPNDDILGKLKISYDGLKKDVQELFLDIACFLREEEEARVMEILDACHFEPTAGVKVLKDRALITINSDGEFDMHDLVQEMAHHIVRGEGNDGKNPEKQRRVWKEEDVVNICAMDIATTNVNMIEVVRFTNEGYKGNEELPNLLQDHPPIVANGKNLRWIEWHGDLEIPLLTNFPQRTLRCLILKFIMQDQLWQGYKFLPCLKIMDLWYLTNLTKTPDFSGIPNLERFKLHGSQYLEEINSSFGLLENLVFVSIQMCPKLKIFPSINGLKNLKTFSLQRCKPGHFELPEIQQENMDSVAHPELGKRGETQVQTSGEDVVDVEECCLEKPSSSHNNINHHTRLWVSHPNLTKLDLSTCGLGDEDIGSFDWELPSLKQLDLEFNDFSRLDFSLLGLPKLKWLNVGFCKSLVELKDLPSSISIIRANYCDSLERFGDTSNCKWLWKVSNGGGYKVDPSEGATLLKSMLKGNAIEDHFIIVSLPNQIPVGFEGSFFKGETFTLRSYIRDTFRVHLRDNWDNDFSGLLMRLVTNGSPMFMDIKISKHESDKEHDYVFLKDSDEEPEPEYEEVMTYVGYVSFSALRQTTSLNSSYNTISFSIDHLWSSFTAELVPRKNKDDPLQTTKASTMSPEFWDEKDKDIHRPGFIIEHDSKSFVNIVWKAWA